MSSPRTGCWVPLKHFHAKVMDFMSVTSPIIFTIERLLTIGTSWPLWQGQTTASGSRRSTQWRNIPSQWRCRGFASGRSAFFLRKLDLLPLHMTWRHLEFTWSLRTSLLFRRRQQLSIVTTGDPGWRALLLLGIELRSPPGISPKRRGACSLLGLGFRTQWRGKSWRPGPGWPVFGKKPYTWRPRRMSLLHSFFKSTSELWK